MNKSNTTMLVILLSLGAIFNTSCTKEEVIDNTSEKAIHHVALYSFSKDLMEIYDVKVEAVCDGKTVSKTNLKKADAYSEDDETVSYNVDTYTSGPVEYKLILKCCKKTEDLVEERKYDLGYNAQFMSVTRYPEKALKILDENADCMPQTIVGKVLQSTYGDEKTFNGQTVYAVYAIVNSYSYLMTE